MQRTRVTVEIQQREYNSNKDTEGQFVWKVMDSVETESAQALAGYLTAKAEELTPAKGY